MFAVKFRQRIDCVIVDVRHESRICVKICVIRRIRSRQVRQRIELFRNSWNFYQIFVSEKVFVLRIDQRWRIEIEKRRQDGTRFRVDDENRSFPTDCQSRFHRHRSRRFVATADTVIGFRAKLRFMIFLILRILKTWNKIELSPFFSNRSTSYIMSCLIANLISGNSVVPVVI